MIAVIMAGGKGTRIAQINSEIPKPMIPILNKPILEYQIDVLKKQNINDIILIVGHLGDKIIDYFEDGSRFNVNISYIKEEYPLGTAGALFLLKDIINDDFLLINGDVIFDVDINRFYKHHKKHKSLVTILTHPNSHPYDSGVIVADDNNKVVKWMTKEDERLWYRNRVNAGIHFIYHKLLTRFNELKKLDLDRDVLKPLIAENELYIYDSPEYIKDMGTPDRYYQVSEDIKNGKVISKNLSQKQKAIFLDRDGTINKYVGFLRNIDDFELIDGVSNAIKIINNSEYLVIVITNQPVIARGEVSIEELNEIHNKMETLLGNDGSYLDAIYYCPHHPDKGFDGEKIEYKIKCSCRKPDIGMLEKARDDFNIDLSSSWFIGDSNIDIQCGKNANCHTAYIGSNNHEIDAEVYGDSLLDIIKKIFKKI